MRVMSLRLAEACWVFALGSCVCAEAREPTTDGGIWNDPEISAAVEKARNGQTREIMGLTHKIKPRSSWEPERKYLPRYYECLGTNENPMVQMFAVEAVRRLKDKSSVEPLQKFVMTAQRRLQGAALSREDFGMLQIALQAAIGVLGEIDGDNELSVSFLGTLLKHDVSKEWGGAVAHSALARKGRSGLKRLLEESVSAQEYQIEYICSAINEISDPSLVGDLYAACFQTNYPARVRGNVLSAIARMRAKSPEAEQLVVDILMNEKSDLRGAAAHIVGRFGSEKGFALLRKLRNAPDKGDELFFKSVNDALLLNDTANEIDGVVKLILSPETPEAKKKELCESLNNVDKGKLKLYAETVATGLDVENATGEPNNAVRVSIWRTLYRSTGVKYPVTLVYKDDGDFKSAAVDIYTDLCVEYVRKGIYDDEQREKMAMEGAKQVVTKWNKQRTGKMGDGK